MSKIELNQGWLLRNEELGMGTERAADVLNRKEGWLETNLPCDVHMPLLENGIIKEPLEAKNCFDCEWVEDKSCWFKKVFNTDEEFLKGNVLELTLESLDSEADIFLNGCCLGHHRSAFYPFKQDVKNVVNKGENVLLIRVASGLEYYSESDITNLKKLSFSYVGGIYNRGDARRLMVRKPQYVYGWDWGPRVATCGIMKGAYIESCSKLAVKSVHIFTKDITLNTNLGFKIEVENLHPYSTIDGTVLEQFTLWRRTSQQ